MERAVLTLALGKPYYTQLAVNLARSFLYWHAGSEIRFHLATNHPDLVPRDLAGVSVIPADEERYGRGFSSKLQLDRLAPAPRTLFIDADCLCYGPLDPVFERFEGRDVSVVGWPIAEGEWFGDVEMRCRRFGLSAVCYFVGAIYYLEPGPRCTAVYDTARALAAQYDALGLVRLRGQPNEEPLLSLAMALGDQNPVGEDGTIKADVMHYQSGMTVDVLRGVARLRNTPSTPAYLGRWPVTESRPRIVHYNAGFTEKDPYLSEAQRLRHVLADGWSMRTATTHTRLTTTWPNSVMRGAKDVLRPVYHRLFGSRSVVPSPRL